MQPFFVALSVICLAELGDKTQLLTLGFAARYPLWEVLGAVACASGVVMALAVVFGGLLNYFIPLIYVQALAGVLFILFGLWTAFGKEEEKEQAKEKARGQNSFWLIFSAFLLAELGDKTQLATLALTTKYGTPLQIWLGATLGMLAINGVGILAGGWLHRVLPAGLIKYLSVAIFLAFGIWTLIELFF